MQMFFGSLMIAAFFWIIVKTFGQSSDAPAPTSRTAVNRMAKVCREIGRTQERLDELDRMLVDIQLCRPEEFMRTFTCQWQSGAENHSYNFLVDGANQTSDNLARMVMAEQDRLRASLLDLTDELQRLRRYGYVTQTIPFSEGEGEEE